MPDQQKKQGVDYGAVSSNSHKTKARAESSSKEESKREPLEKVISGKAVARKRSVGRKFLDLFKSGDTESVKDYVVFDVLIPQLKNTIVDVAREGIERMILGEIRGSSRSAFTSRGHVSYNRMSGSTRTTSRPEEPRRSARVSRGSHDFSDIVLEDRGQAEAVMDKLDMLIDQYGTATVQDLYEMVGITGSFTDGKWGWIEMRGFDTRRDRDGYVLLVPTPIALE